jgi:hypothetical protein
MTTNKPKSENYRKALEFALWLAPDCGGCEDCIRMFSQKDHDHLQDLINTLPEEEQEEFHRWF